MIEIVNVMSNKNQYCKVLKIEISYYEFAMHKRLFFEILESFKKNS